MLICMSYSLGNSSWSKRFDTFKEVNEFIINYINISQSESNFFELSVYYGKEEERVRGYYKKDEDTLSEKPEVKT